MVTAKYIEVGNDYPWLVACIGDLDPPFYFAWNLRTGEHLPVEQSYVEARAHVQKKKRIEKWQGEVEALKALEETLKQDDYLL